MLIPDPGTTDVEPCDPPEHAVSKMSALPMAAALKVAIRIE
jgi:hypothetical protein